MEKLAFLNERDTSNLYLDIDLDEVIKRNLDNANEISL